MILMRNPNPQLLWINKVLKKSIAQVAKSDYLIIP